MPDASRLSINLAIVREQWDLRHAVEGCARAGTRAVAPWRDQVARIGLAESARIIEDHGMTVERLYVSVANLAPRGEVGGEREPEPRGGGRARD